jgi:hypothetical protein
MPKLVTTYLYQEQRAEVLYGEPMAALGRRARSLHDRTRPAGAVTVPIIQKELDSRYIRE